MIYAIYETIRKDKLQRLLQFALYNDDTLFIEHLLNCIHNTDTTLWNDITTWLFLECIHEDHTNGFQFLLEYHIQNFRFMFILYHTHKTSMVVPHPLLYAVELQKPNIVQYILTTNQPFFNIKPVFNQCLRISITHHSFHLIEMLLQYYYNPDNIFYTCLDTVQGIHSSCILDDLVRVSIDHSLLTIFEALVAHEDILPTYRHDIENLISRNNTTCVMFMNVLHDQYEFDTQVRQWIEFYIAKYDNIECFLWYENTIGILDTYEFILLLMMYDAWKLFNWFYLEDAVGLHDMLRQHFHLLVSYIPKSYNILNFTLTNVSNIDIYRLHASTSYVEYALQYNLLEIAYILLSIPDRQSFPIHKSCYHLYRNCPEIVPFLLPAEIETLIQMSYGDYYTSTIPEYLQSLYTDIFLDHSPAQEIKVTDDICLICREIPTRYVLCSNTIKPHPISIDCLRQMDNTICPYCRESLNLSTHFLNEPQTIQQ